MGEFEKKEAITLLDSLKSLQDGVILTSLFDLHTHLELIMFGCHS